MDTITKHVYDKLLKREYRKERKDVKVDISSLLREEISLPLRVSGRLQKMVEAESASLDPQERIGFRRNVREIPDVLTREEREALEKDYLLFDSGLVCNISSDYETPLNVGFDSLLYKIEDQRRKAENKKEKDELLAMRESILAMYAIVKKYRDEAERIGNAVLANILKNVPYNRPRNYHEALVFMRIINYMLWLNNNKHNTVGRFDQYMYPFYRADIDKGTLTYDEAKALTEEFFVSLNFDADLYPGIQQGDNGQSMVLGGVTKSGEDAYNELSKLCLEASLEVRLIDPKINLRVNKHTDIKWYELGTRLTEQGLGFPQYSNDDVVIPALVRWGYDIEDARDYVVAACWEFIIPKVAMDIPNIDAMNFPLMVDNALRSEKMREIECYDEFYALVKEEIATEVKRLADRSKNFFIIPSPFQSVLMKDCIEKRRDIADGGKYNNMGFHGAGVSNASDALEAIKEHLFDKKDIEREELIKALDANFEGYDRIRKMLIESPKMGNNEEEVDQIGTALLDCFAEECGKYKNCRGGIYRPGTGTAMYYIWYSEHMGATADGRKKGEPFSANFSPSLNHNFKGVLSVVQSFTKPHLEKVCNGGPLTLEFHDTLFRNDEGREKVAMLVKTFIGLGGHQLQLNAINRDTLLDAQKHPEDHKNLIVRVWGWSGYFNELDLVYQNHIIKRLEFMN